MLKGTDAREKTRSATIFILCEKRHRKLRKLGKMHSSHLLTKLTHLRVLIPLLVGNLNYGL